MTYASKHREQLIDSMRERIEMSKPFYVAYFDLDRMSRFNAAFGREGAKHHLFV